MKFNTLTGLWIKKKIYIYIYINFSLIFLFNTILTIILVDAFVAIVGKIECDGYKVSKKKIL